MWSACPSSRLTGSLLSAAEVVRAVVCLTAGVELSIDAGDVSLPATLDVPPVGPVRGAVVVLHGSAVPQRSYFLYEHLARELPRAGVAVLRFDRRLHEHGDVPFAVQADDTVAAVAELRRRMGDVRVGLWGWSQGTWPALVVAARRPELVAFLVLVATSGVSPAVQMRYGTAQQLLQRGYGDADLAELARLREALEGAVRGHIDRATAQAVVDRYADRPWFPLAHVPRDLLGHRGTWEDMDYDPQPVIAQVNCPTLLFYGDSDEWTPAEDSIAVWRRVASTNDLTIHRLTDCTHMPTRSGAETLESVSPDYTSTLLGWIGERISHRPR
ncbi:alpha/beta hydrolase [Verrucosispora sp. CWR15]|uniref:Alpha/beta hydrolase n=2 Tax=Verrucosispora sioxanthis TaxID=2499994 RepID=A0A6M1LDW1_9ACTN|nr:alpha/beta hydrolase [Verrucosispora sioxanthis]NGM16381.1 alpha/beta hydrolase [Verrucosispora sioxanthis]